MYRCFRRDLVCRYRVRHHCTDFTFLKSFLSNYVREMYDLRHLRVTATEKKQKIDGMKEIRGAARPNRNLINSQQKNARQNGI
jgi:hypothetical protein